MMNPMIIISGPVLMDTYVDDDEPHTSEKEFVYTEGITMYDAGVIYMKTELCPTGGHDNILRFKKSFVGKITDADQRHDMAEPVDDGGDGAVPVDDSGGSRERRQARPTWKKPSSLECRHLQ